MNNTAMHLVGNQTLFWKEQGSLLDCYGGLVEAPAPNMERFLNTLLLMPALLKSHL